MHAAHEAPSWLPVIPDAIPAALRARRNFVGWRACWRAGRNGKPGKWTKVPYRQDGSGTASSTDPATWCKLSFLLLRLRAFDGVGFALSDGICGIDLDHCRDPQSGAIEPWAQRIVAAVPTYWEVTPSGCGLRAFAYGQLPGGGLKRGRTEIYDTGRYLTVTGHHIDGTADDLADCQEQIAALYAQVQEAGGDPIETPVDEPQEERPARRKRTAAAHNGHAAAGPTDDEIVAKAAASTNGAEFSRLWAGGTTGYASQSEADLALCNYLAFFAGPDAGRLDRLFRASGLMRDKWDESHFGDGTTYGQATVRQALADRTEFFDWDRGRRKRQPRRIVAEHPEGVDDAELPAPLIDIDEGRTDVANGRRFAQRFHGRFRWSQQMRSWFVWDGRRWAGEFKNETDAAAKQIYTDHWRAIGEASEVSDDTLSAMIAYAKYTGSGRGIENMLKMARSEPRIPVRAEELDAHPWLLNCENGTIDLRTGELQPHSKEDMLTKLAPVAYNPDAECPIWESFLDTIMGSNTELVDFLQRAAGMSLTGVIRDHALLVMYGTGQNGKSTFLNTLQHTIGPDYSMKAPLGMLMAKKDESHPTERADLKGKRFVTCIEVEEGARIAESLIKELTGGDKVRARFMRQDHFEFDPTHHIWMSVNHRPEVRGTDAGIWRRIKLVPFSVSIPEPQQDRELPEKLMAERPGILAWAVRGCLEWLAGGLREPPEVSAATAEYRGEQDVLASFLADRCDISRMVMGVMDYRVKAAELYQSYKDWCDESGEYHINERRFRASMTERGIRRERTSRARWYVGIRLRDTSGQEDTQEELF